MTPKERNELWELIRILALIEPPIDTVVPMGDTAWNTYAPDNQILVKRVKELVENT